MASRSLRRVLSLSATALILGAAPGREPSRLADPDPSDHQPVAVARWPGFPLLPDRQFPIGAWCAPPPRETSDERYAEYAGAGLNVTMGMLEDPYLPGPSLRRLQVSRRHHVYAFVRDNRVHPDEARRSGWRADVDSTIRAYPREPALLGYFLADEPDPPLFASLGALNRRFAQRDPRHPGYANLLGFGGPGAAYHGLCYTAFLRRYIDDVRPAFFSIDHYPLREGSDSPYFLAVLDSTAYVSQLTGVPFWAVLQLTPHLELRKPTPTELAWQANLALAYGARGIVWFTYWSPNPAESFHYRDGPISYDGRRNPSYDAVRSVNGRIQALGKELSRMRHLGVRHVGPVPYGCAGFRGSTELRIHCNAPLAAGFFQGNDLRTYVLLVNRDYVRATTARITARRSFGTWDQQKGFYRSARPGSSIAIGPGEAQLVRLPIGVNILH